MATQEFYVRNESETEARGPFNFEQLSSLTDNGQVTADTLFYDANTEQWAPISSNEELKQALFPEKRKLQMRTASNVGNLNQESSDSRPPITVDDMLAAAEGRTADTKDRLDPGIAMGRAAALGRWGCIAMLILSVAAELLPEIDFLMAFKPGELLSHPLVILGVGDVILTVLLLLGAVTVYPVVRFRAALGLGFLGFVFYTQGLSLPLLAIAAGSFGMYFCTISVNMLVVLICAVIGLAGMAGVAYQMLVAA